MLRPHAIAAHRNASLVACKTTGSLGTGSRNDGKGIPRRAATLKALLDALARNDKGEKERKVDSKKLGGLRITIIIKLLDKAETLVR